MSRVLHEVGFTDAAGISAVRRQTRAVARALELAPATRTRLATAVAEASHVALALAGGGHLRLALEPGAPMRLSATVSCPNTRPAAVEEARSELLARRGGPRRLVDTLVVTGGSEALTIELGITLPEAVVSAGKLDAMVARLGVEVARRGTPQTELRRQQRELLIALDKQVRVERTLRLSEARLRLAVNVADVGLIEREPKSELFSASERAAAMLGIAEQASLEEILCAADEASRDAIREALTAPLAGEPIEKEVRLASRPERWLAIRARDLVAGASTRRVAAIQDVTIDRLREREIRRALEIEKQLIGIVSHDLKNPIGAALMNAQLLTRSKLDQRQTATVQGLTRALHRSLRLVHDLLDFTRARLGPGIPIEEVACDLRAISIEAAANVEAAHPGRSIDVMCTGDAHGHWDHERLLQALINLLENAVAHSPSPAPVVLRVQGTAGEVHVEVENRGEAIPARQRERLFEPFVRGDDDANSRRSIGLGLFIVRHIAERHGGMVEVTSCAAATVFRLRLPRHASATDPSA